jgi:hypothetical protein
VTVWREVKEALYGRFVDEWQDGGEPRTVVDLPNEPALDPPEEGYTSVFVQRRPGGNGTIGKPGSRKMDRRGVVFIIVRRPKGEGSGLLADLAQHAADVFENCRVPVHGIRFGNVDIGEASPIDGSRWYGVTVEAPFDYEETK